MTGSQPGEGIARRGLALGWDSEAAERMAWGLLGRLMPYDGWLAFGLLAINLCVVVLSVEQADWAPTPNLAGILLLGMLTAFAFHRLPVWWWLAIIPGLILGALTIGWQMSGFTFDGEPLGGVSALVERLGLWLDAADEGSINIDKVPFAFGLVTASWLMGFFGAWVFLRHRNFWGVFALSGLGLFSNLTFLPPNTNFHLGMYLFTALLLVARIQAVRRQNHWDRRGIKYDEGLRSLTLSDSFFLGLGVIAIAFLLPAAGTWSTATGAYESLRRPLVTLEDDFNRLFAGLPARRDIGFRIWDDVMAFQGTISPGDSHTLLVESPVPMYWKARTYDTYTSQGWISEHSEFQSLDYSPEFSAPASRQNRVSVTYAVTPLYSSKHLFAGSQVEAVDRDVVIETPTMPAYHLSVASGQWLVGEELDEPLNTLYWPRGSDQWLQSIAGKAQEHSAAADGELIAQISPLLPPNFRIGAMERQDGQVVGVTLEEALPDPPDTLAVRSRKGVLASYSPYIVTSSVPAAEPDQLRQAGTDYPAHILERYLQLPPDIPGRIGGLAREITLKHDTPYDKAAAVEANLKRLEYSLTVDPPPYDVDGVDFFLFQQRRGYSEYFSSAMAVMLRTMGVPARVAVGYTTGDPTDVENLFAVTDSHSHGWVEVYFPGYGWIPFEPTPGVVLPVVMMPGGADRGEFTGPFFAEFDVECLDDFVEECIGAGEPFGPGSELTEGDASDGGTPVWVWVIVALGIAAIVLLLAWRAFQRFMFVPRDPHRSPEEVYRRVQALAALGGLSGGALGGLSGGALGGLSGGAFGGLPGRLGMRRQLTPYQFGERLAALMPLHSERVALIVESYVQSRYGGRPTSPHRQGQLDDAWLNLRFPLLMASLGQRIYPRPVV